MSQKLEYICKCKETKTVTYQGFLNRKIGCKTCSNKREPKQIKPRSPQRVITFDIVKQEFMSSGVYFTFYRIYK